MTALCSSKYLYAIHLTDWHRIPSPITRGAVHFIYTHDSMVYVYALYDKAVAEEPWTNDTGDLVTLEDYAVNYVPSDSEIVEALRGPRGFAGPKGDRGHVGDVHVYNIDTHNK